jgi:DNA-binding NarL/FixJ family response regulator
MMPGMGGIDILRRLRKEYPEMELVISHEIQSPLSVVQITVRTHHDGYIGDLEPKEQEIGEAIMRNYFNYSKMDMENFCPSLEGKNSSEMILCDIFRGLAPCETVI